MAVSALVDAFGGFRCSDDVFPRSSVRACCAGRTARRKPIPYDHCAGRCSPVRPPPPSPGLRRAPRGRGSATTASTDPRRTTARPVVRTRGAGRRRPRLPGWQTHRGAATQPPYHPRGTKNLGWQRKACGCRVCPQTIGVRLRVQGLRSQLGVTNDRFHSRIADGHPGDEGARARDTGSHNTRRRRRAQDATVSMPTK